MGSYSVSQPATRQMWHSRKQGNCCQQSLSSSGRTARWRVTLSAHPIRVMIRKHDVARKTACTHYITYRITVVRGGPRQKNKSCNVCRKFGQVKPVVLTEVGYASEHARGQTDTFISLLCTPPGEISKDEHQRPLIFFFWLAWTLHRREQYANLGRGAGVFRWQAGNVSM